MKKYTKPSMEIVDLTVEENITAPTTFYKRGKATLNLLKTADESIEPGSGVTDIS